MTKNCFSGYLGSKDPKLSMKVKKKVFLNRLEGGQ